MDRIRQHALLVQTLKLLNCVEDPLVTHQGRVLEKTKEEVCQRVGQPGVRSGREQGPAADVVQVDVGGVNKRHQL